jgi:hypothetical protein
MTDELETLFASLGKELDRLGTEEHFARGARDPRFQKLMTKLETAIRRDDWNTFCELSKLSGIQPEVIMRNFLADLQKRLEQKVAKNRPQ